MAEAEPHLVSAMTVNGKPGKPSPVEELLRILRRVLDYCLCCITCGCYPGPRDNLHVEVYEAELMDEERRAIQNLLKYLDSSEAKEPTINEERLRALCILTFSDNEDLQRSASLCFAEISERMRVAVTESQLEPLVILLQSRDPQVQKAASLAISNFALNGPDKNKAVIMSCGALKPIVQLLHSSNHEVQCNTCGCITTLATNDANKQAIILEGGVKPLLQLACSEDARVQRNATGALLNLTHLQVNRNVLVELGALPILVEALHSRDTDVQYYCSAALSNMAVNEKHRVMMVAVGHYDVVKRLIRLLSSLQEKVRCQACLALRNLASDGDNQMLIVKLGGLGPLHAIIRYRKGESLTAALACLRNLSILRANEAAIIAETFLSSLRLAVVDSSNPEAQRHAAGTIRNLAAGEQIQAMSDSGCMDALIVVVLNHTTATPVLVETTAALAVLADEDENKTKILQMSDGKAFLRLVALAGQSDNSEVAYNCAGTVGQLALVEIPSPLLHKAQQGLFAYLCKFMESQDPSCIHIALWTLVQFLKSSVGDSNFLEWLRESSIPDLVTQILQTEPAEAIKELAETVVTYTSTD